MIARLASRDDVRAAPGADAPDRDALIVNYSPHTFVRCVRLVTWLSPIRRNPRASAQMSVLRALVSAVLVATVNCAVTQRPWLCQTLSHCQRLGHVASPVLTLSAQEEHLATARSTEHPERLKQLVRPWEKLRTALTELSTAASIPVACTAAVWSWPAQPAFAAATTVATWAPKGPLLRRGLRLTAAVGFAWYAMSLKSAGPRANPERYRAGQPIRCPWPFLLVAIPWTPLGWRSIKAGLRDWQTWVVVALVFLRSALI